MTTLLGRFANDQSGTTSVEYALIAVFVSVLVLTALPALSSQVVSPINQVATKLMEANKSPGLVPSKRK